MKATGVIRNIDHLGRLCVPMEIRKAFDIPTNTPIEIYTSDNGNIILRKYQPGCACCGQVNGKLIKKNGVSICVKCLSELVDSIN